MFLLASFAVHAEDTTGTPPLPNADEMPPPSAQTGEERPIPDYDGRPDEPPSAGEVLIWVPRVVFYPVHLTLEYLVRWPLVSLITVMEEYYVLQHVMDIFTWFEGKAGVFPTAFYEFGISPSVGFYAFQEDVFGPGSKQVLKGGFWDDKQQLALENRMPVFRDNSGLVFLNAMFSNRPDHPFYGTGYSTREDQRTNYNMLNVQGELGLQGILEGLNRVEFALGYRYVVIDDGSSPSIADEHQGDYHLLFGRLDLDLDTRSPHRDFTSGTGLRLELGCSYLMDPANPDLQFLLWGGEASGFLDLSGSNHVVGLRIFTQFAEKIGDDPLPVTEVVVLNNKEHLRAFLGGRFRGESAAVITAEYRYPIWAYLDGELFVGLGNTFDKHLEGFSWERMYLNWGIGVRTNNSRDVSFDILVALGSNRLDSESFKVDRVGFIIGVNQGF